MTPLLLELLRPEEHCSYLDLGSGEGRVMRAVAGLGAVVHGIDISEDLARRATSPTLVATLPDIPIRSDSYDGIYAVLVLEHLEEHRAMFAEAARVARPGGTLVVVSNHPVWTAPGSTPITDDDGEVLWRPGAYFGEGYSEVPAGDQRVVFHHRSMASLLGGAAEMGWCLERMIEQPHHELTDQSGIPRLLGVRWRLEGHRPG